MGAVGSVEGASRNGYEHLLRMRDRATLSTDQFRSLLTQHGFTVKTWDHTYTIPDVNSNEGGKFSTQALNEKRLNLNLTYSTTDDQYNPDTFVDMKWKFEYNHDAPTGSDTPADLVLITWPNYDYVYQTKYWGDYCHENNMGDSEDPSGIAIKYAEDAHATDVIAENANKPHSKTNYDFGSHCGAYIDPEHDTPDTRELFFDYIHFTSHMDYNVSIGSSGVSISPGISTATAWRKEVSGPESEFN